jgi:hypothetical protein
MIVKNIPTLLTTYDNDASGSDVGAGGVVTVVTLVPVSSVGAPAVANQDKSDTNTNHPIIIS